MNKAEAAEVLQALGLSTVLPVVCSASSIDSPEWVRREVGPAATYVARVSAAEAELNLARLVGATAEQTYNWASQLPPETRVLLSPYEELLFCGQLAVYADLVSMELVSGMWEMRASRPLRITAEWVGTETRWNTMSAPENEQECAWLHEPESTLGRVEAWMVSAAQDWVIRVGSGLRALLEMHCAPYGLKIQYTAATGVAAQNFYAGVPFRSAVFPPDRPPDCPIVESASAPIPRSRSIELAVSLAREEADVLEELMRRLRAAGVHRVHVRSGLLSHSAIRLREEGFEVAAIS